MQYNIYEFRREKAGTKNHRVDSKKGITPDHPFDYDKVTKITGAEYARYLNRDGIAMLPYEEVKRNISGMYLKSAGMPTYTNVSGFQVADDYYYHPGHSWVHMERYGRIRIGIDDFTSKVFGPADTINLPSVGDYLKQGEVGWELARNDHKAPMVSPLSGTVISVNDNVRKRTDIIHDDPHDAGYLLVLDPLNLELDMKKLFTGKECSRWIEKENQSLLEILGPEYERLAATGANVIGDIYGHFPEIDWDRLVIRFLQTGMTR